MLVDDIGLFGLNNAIDVYKKTEHKRIKKNCRIVKIGG